MLERWETGFVIREIEHRCTSLRESLLVVRVAFN